MASFHEQRAVKCLLCWKRYITSAEGLEAGENECPNCGGSAAVEAGKTVFGTEDEEQDA